MCVCVVSVVCVCVRVCACVRVCVCARARVCYTHRVSSPTVSEEARGLGWRVVVGMMVLEGTTSVVSVISIICIQ